MAQAQFDIRNWTLQDLRDCLDATGYIDQPEEWEFASDNDAFKYIGFSDHHHKFLVGFFDADADDLEQEAYASICFVGLSPTGLHADWGGCPVKFGMLDEVLKYIEERCN